MQIAMLTASVISPFGQECRAHGRNYKVVDKYWYGVCFWKPNQLLVYYVSHCDIATAKNTDTIVASPTPVPTRPLLRKELAAISTSPCPQELLYCFACAPLRPVQARCSRQRQVKPQTWLPRLFGPKPRVRLKTGNAPTTIVTNTAATTTTVKGTVKNGLLDAKTASQTRNEGKRPQAGKKTV